MMVGVPSKVLEDIEQTAGGKKRDELVIAHSDTMAKICTYSSIDEGVTLGVMIHYQLWR